MSATDDRAPSDARLAPPRLELPRDGQRPCATGSRSPPTRCARRCDSLVGQGHRLRERHRLDVPPQRDLRSLRRRPRGGTSSSRRFLSEWRGLEPAALIGAGLPARGRRGGAAPLPRRVRARLDGARRERGARPGPAGAAPRPGIGHDPRRCCTGSSSPRSPRANGCARRRRSRGTRSPSCRSGSSSRRRCSATSRSGPSSLLGAGETGSLFARQAVEAGVRDLRIANRTDDTARDPRRRACRASAVPWEDFSRELGEADVVVGTTASPRPVVRRDDVENAMRQRRGTADVLPRPRRAARRRRRRPGRLQHVRLRRERPRERRARRTASAARGRSRAPRRSSRKSSRSFSRGWATSPSSRPSPCCGSKLERIRDEELARLSPEDRERLRPFADSLAARLLHEPMRRLKTEPDPARRLDRVEAVRHLFDLDRRRRRRVVMARAARSHEDPPRGARAAPSRSCRSKRSRAVLAPFAETEIATYGRRATGSPSSTPSIVGQGRLHEGDRRGAPRRARGRRRAQPEGPPVRASRRASFSRPFRRGEDPSDVLISRPRVALRGAPAGSPRRNGKPAPPRAAARRAARPRGHRRREATSTRGSGGSRRAGGTRSCSPARASRASGALEEVCDVFSAGRDAAGDRAGRARPRRARGRRRDRRRRSAPLDHPASHREVLAERAPAAAARGAAAGRRSPAARRRRTGPCASPRASSRSTAPRALREEDEGAGRRPEGARRTAAPASPRRGADRLLEEARPVTAAGPRRPVRGAGAVPAAGAGRADSSSSRKISHEIVPVSPGPVGPRAGRPISPSSRASRACGDSSRRPALERSASRSARSKKGSVAAVGEATADALRERGVDPATSSAADRARALLDRFPTRSPAGGSCFRAARTRRRSFPRSLHRRGARRSRRFVLYRKVPLPPDGRSTRDRRAAVRRVLRDVSVRGALALRRASGGDPAHGCARRRPSSSGGSRAATSSRTASPASRSRGRPSFAAALERSGRARLRPLRPPA